MTELLFRICRRLLTVRKFLALCKAASIGKSPLLLSAAPVLSQSQQQSGPGRPSQTCNDGELPSPSLTAPLLPTSENSEQLHGDLSALSQLGVDSEETYTDNTAPVQEITKKTPTDNGSPHGLPVPQFRHRRSASFAQLKLPTEARNIYTTPEEAPSPSPTKPLLQPESPQDHLAIDVKSSRKKDEDNITRMLEEKNLDLLQQMDGAQGLATVFDSHLESGKNTGSGEPIFTHKKQLLFKDFPRFLARACNRYTIFILIISGCVSLVFETLEKSLKNGWRDGTAILMAALLIVTVDSVSAFRQARNLEIDRSKERRIEVEVIRSGQRRPIPILGIVKGELVCLEEGRRVPADGLLVSGSLEVDGRSDKNIDCNQNPFLFSGSTVVRGDGRMLVASIGSNAEGAREPLLSARIRKPNECAEFLSLCMALFILIVLFLRFLREKHKHLDAGSSPTKGQVTVGGVLKIFERLLKPQGTIRILTSFLAAAVIGIQHGMPFVISFSLAYWNEKMATNGVDLQNLSACGTMGLVTVICIDVSGGLIGQEEAAERPQLQLESLKEAVQTFKRAKIDIKLVSGDGDLPALANIASELGIFVPDSTDEAVEGQYIRDHLSTEGLKTRADRIKVMANFLPNDKLRMVRCLKENGHVVAFYGGSTVRDALVLKEADVGISDEGCTELAKKSSDITIESYGSFIHLIPICRCGRWAYHNIQKFMQLQLIVMVSGLVISSVATMALGDSPITLIQMMWVNLITWILGGLMIVMEPPQRQELHTLQAPSKRDEPAITMAMWVGFLTQVGFQASVLLAFLFIGKIVPSIHRRVQKAVIFNTFAVCQLFNYANAMELERKWCDAIKQKGGLLVSVVAAVGAQVVVAEIWARLNQLEWGFCFLIAGLSWGLGLGMKALSPSMDNWSFSSLSSQLRRYGWMPSRCDFCFILFSSLFFLF